ncbi:MAG: ATP-binding cassette domain-containing protein [Microbacteriaceae bacterium]
MSTLLEVRDVTVRFHRGRTRVTAVDAVDLELRRGEILGLVGESGCGKSTLARAIAGAQPVDAGTIRLDGEPLGGRRSPRQRRAVQMVFQDPYAALNPALRIGPMLVELLRVHRLAPRGREQHRAAELLAAVGIGPAYLTAWPHSLSGGQRQRINIARALALEPELLIADEAVSALDASVQASVVNLLLELRERLGLSILFISHNLAVVRQIADRIAVMHAGRIVETGEADLVFAEPGHAYTRELLAAIPRLRTDREEHR